VEPDLSGVILDGRYRVIEPISEGAMGVVYKAERLKLGRIVAIKVLHDELPAELSSRKRFEIEAMAMAKLEHPHCASVVDVGVHDDKPFVVMDFVSGSNLRDLVAEGPMSLHRAVEIVRQVLSGLAHAHDLGIIHRDIKPANIVLSQKAGLGDHVKILDFGLARIADTPKVTTGIVVGTPSYMAPEQIRGTAIDHRADLYACGVLLFELLTGNKPFVSAKDDPVEVCSMHLKNPPPALRDVQPGIEFGELEAIVGKALGKKPEDRYATAVDFASALDAIPRRVASSRSAPVAIAPGTQATETGWAVPAEAKSSMFPAGGDPAIAKVMAQVAPPVVSNAPVAPAPVASNAPGAPAPVVSNAPVAPAPVASNAPVAPAVDASPAMAPPAAGTPTPPLAPMARAVIGAPPAPFARPTAPSAPRGVPALSHAAPSAPHAVPDALSGATTAPTGPGTGPTMSPPGTGPTMSPPGTDPTTAPPGTDPTTAPHAHPGYVSGATTAPHAGAPAVAQVSPAVDSGLASQPSPPAPARGLPADFDLSRVIPTGTATGVNEKGLAPSFDLSIAIPSPAVPSDSGKSAPGFDVSLAIPSHHTEMPILERSGATTLPGTGTPATAETKLGLVAFDPKQPVASAGTQPKSSTTQTGHPAAADARPPGANVATTSGAGATSGAAGANVATHAGAATGSSAAGPTTAAVSTSGPDAATQPGELFGSEIHDVKSTVAFVGAPPAGPSPLAAPDAPAAAEPVALPPPPMLPALPVTKKQLQIIGATAGAILLIAIIAGTCGGEKQSADKPGSVPSEAAPAVAPTPPPADNPADDQATKITELIDAGKTKEAMDQAIAARKVFPKDPRLAYLLGKLYFDRQWWTQGLKQFRDTLALDATYRSDPDLIRTVLRAFITPAEYPAQLGAFLRNDIGAPAKQYLEETATSHPRTQTRARARNEISKMK
jgi:serine/threonine-protein kinase